jgi:hypothetical protein
MTTIIVGVDGTPERTGTPSLDRIGVYPGSGSGDVEPITVAS